MKLLIIGHGQYSHIVREIAEENNDYLDIKYIDDIASSDVVATFDEFFNNLSKYNKEYDAVTIALNNLDKRYSILYLLNEYNFNLINLISKNAFVSKSSVIEKGTIIEAGVVINANSLVKQCSIISANAVINHNCIINECCHIDCNATVEANSNVPNKTKVKSNTVYSNKKTDRELKTPDGDYKFEDGV